MSIPLRSPVTLPLHELGWPRPSSSVEFRITSPFGYRDNPLNPGTRSFHNGIDIGNGRLGYPVVAIAAGSVILASNKPTVPWNYPTPVGSPAAWGPSYGGNVVVIDHGNGLYSEYAHLGRIEVSYGQKVSAGRQVGTIGQTGSAYQRGHLHLSLRYDNQWVNPEPYVRLGRLFMFENEGEDMYFTSGISAVVNRACDIRSGTRYRSAPNLRDDSILGTTSSGEGTHFRPTFLYSEGAEANGSRAWYWGPLWVDGKGYGFVFVHASRCTPLTPIEEAKSPTVKEALVIIQEALGL